MKTYALNGVNPNPHESFFFPSIRKVVSSAIRGICVINVHMGRQEAYFFKDGKKFFLGSSAANEHLMESSEDEYIVNYESADWEQTLFNMRRDKYGMWHAKDEHIKGIDLLLGTSESITFEKIALADRFFYSQRKDVTFKNPNDASLAFKVS